MNKWQDIADMTLCKGVYDNILSLSYAQDVVQIQ